MREEALNLATGNKWIASIPFKKIDKDLTSETVDFNLASFNLPDMDLGFNTVQYQGYEIDIPNYVRTQSKEVTFEYMLSSDWHQYKILYKWLSKISKEDGSGIEIDPDTGLKYKADDYLLNIRVLMLSEFKKPIMEIIYKDCWIQNFGSISLDYQDSEAEAIKHVFTCKYKNFEIVEDPT